MKAQTMLKILVSAALTVALAVTASASFAKKNTYGGQFTDVKETSWYAKEVSSAYELGFVEGVSDTQYSPDTTVTVAQGITMASRVHAEYNGKTIESKTDGGKWYQMYVDYAMENGIITKLQFDDYTREIKRYEMAELFHDAMGEKYYTAVNSIKNVPDVNIGAMYRDKILTLYNAGVLTGNDKYGVFTPDASIKRSECAAIINRVALPENRKQVSLEPLSSGEAYVLCYNEGNEYFKEGINSGWVVDNRGNTGKSTIDTTATIGDISEVYGSAFIREFNYIETGDINLDIEFLTKDNGAYLEYRDIDGNSTYMIKVVDGKWSVLTPDGKFVPVSDVVVAGKTLVRASVNLDTGKSTTYINGKNCGTFDLLSDNILSFAIGVDEKGTGAVTLGTVNMTVNYAVCENFDDFGLDASYGWQDIVMASYTDSTGQIDMSPGSKITKKFDKVSGGFIFETYFISKNGQDFNIKLGDSLTFAAADKKFSANGKELYTLSQNMWYRLRVEGNTTEGKAEILLNGRTIGSVDLATKNDIDTLTYDSVGYFAVDNIKVYEYEKPSDYVPAPTTRASLDDYIVGMNICSLWRNGTHFGWSCITPYEERKPVLGYYDEGVPEMADWEIKYMVEHGIDVQAFCWFQEASTGPVKTPRNGEQLHNGYMYAEYSDYMKYVLLWEAQNSQKVDSVQFRTNIVPYWFENYFLDDRYLKIDNQIVLTVYGYDKLASGEYFKNAKGVKAEFDYLEEKAKEYGFDGFIFLYSGGEVANDRYAAYGFDGSFGYNWGKDGKNFSKNVEQNERGAKTAKTVYQVPTITVGYDTFAWHSARADMATVEEFGKGVEWVKNTYIPTYASKASWADKLVWLSTWNEYGEGTFIMPAGDKGFGYVDQIRKHLTNLPEAHTDVVPTAHQAERINHLYPQYATLARNEGWYDYNKTSQQEKAELKNKLFVNDVDVASTCDKLDYIPPIKVDDRLLFPYNGATGITNLLGAYSEWRREVGTLKIVAHGHELVFQDGSDKYMKDGVLCDLGYVSETFDGLMMLDFEALAKDLGYKTSKKGNDLYITTDTYETAWKNDFRLTTGDWQFDHPFNDEGWTTTNSTLITSGGTMTINSIPGNNDVILNWLQKEFPEDFLTERFSSVELKCRYDYKPVYESNMTTKIYYITDIDSTWSENKNIKFEHEASTTNGEWVTYKVDLTNLERWVGAQSIIGIRFDPFDGQGTFEIDYLKFISPEGYVYIPESEKPIEIKNGDAENEIGNPHTSHNAEIIRIEDPDKKGNHVWQVKPTSNGQFTYFHSPVKYKEYMKYKIEYDIKLVANDAGSATPNASRFATNFKYTDKGALNDYDHIVRSGRDNISFEDGWVHYEGEFTVGKIDSNAKSQFAIYMNPADGQGFEFYLDNIVVTELGSTINQFTKFDWETLEGKVIFDEKTKTFDAARSMCEYEIADGKLVVKSVGEKNDPQFHLPSGFKAEEYDGIAVRVKAEGIDVSKDFFQIYYSTDAEPNLSESKSISLKYKDMEYDDEEGYMTLLFDFSENSAAWKGTITDIRVDPANAFGTFTFTDIVLVKA